MQDALLARVSLTELQGMRVDDALVMYDARQRARAGEIADALWVARVGQAEQKDYAKASAALNREAGRG